MSAEKVFEVLAIAVKFEDLCYCAVEIYFFPVESLDTFAEILHWSLKNFALLIKMLFTWEILM